MNVALVGLGWWGRIIPATIVQASRRLKIVRLVNINVVRASDVAAMVGAPLTDRFEDALVDSNVDAVILVTSHGVHKSQVAAAAAAGKHVFCEKPLGLSRASAERSVEHCASAKVVLGVEHERRFEAPIRAVRELLKKGALGVQS